jgi:hypothetical protein
VGAARVVGIEKLLLKLFQRRLRPGRLRADFRFWQYSVVGFRDIDAIHDRREDG